MEGSIQTASFQGPAPNWPKETITRCARNEARARTRALLLRAVPPLRCCSRCNAPHVAPLTPPCRPHCTNLTHQHHNNSFEDLELAIDAAARVNTHLQAETQAVVAELRRARKERDAWQRHARHLSRTLAAERRQHRREQQHGGDGGGGSGEQRQQAEQQRIEQRQEQRRRQRRQDGDEDGDGDAVLLDAEGEEEAAALAKLPPDAEAAAAGAPPPPGAFEWPGSASTAAQLSALVAKGRAAGWLVAPADVELGPLLGAGAFGETHRARWRGGADVAVKKVRIASEQDLVSFLREVECLSRVRHPGVVPFLGAALRGAGHCWLLSEFMAGGNLAAYLHGPAARRGGGGGGGGGPALPPPSAAATGPAAAPGASSGGSWFGFGGGARPALVERLERALEVAGALAALEAADPPVLHRDVKPSNVFLDAGGRARLGDFGLARLAPASAAELTGETGTYLYMAPEVVRHEVYDAKADVWSFGVLLCELASRAVPYASTYLTPVQVAMAVADEALRPAPPPELPASLLVVCHACCDFDPAMRPDFSVVAEMLASAIKEIRASEAAAAAAAAAGGGGLLGRLLGGAAVPESWVSVLASLAGGGGGGSGSGSGGGGGGDGGGGGPGGTEAAAPPTS